MKAHILAPFLLSAMVFSCSSSDSGTVGDPDSGASGDTDGSGMDAGGDGSTPADSASTDTGGGSDTAPGTDTGPATDTGRPADSATDTPPATGIKTVFLIVMENHNWSSITSSSSAPYINKTLLPQASYAKQYFNPKGNHPSEPNYIWLEAADNLGLTTDSDPSTTNHVPAGTDHLVSQLNAAGVSWKTYQEDIDGKTCPLSSSGLYGVKHNPFLFFDDVTDARSKTSAGCIAHVRPYTELAADLAAGKVARYNFITPNLCNDMHGDGGCTSTNTIKMGDDWLAAEVPKILASAAYKDNGALFITWDEAATGDGPIGMIVLSPLAKGGGYSNSTTYDHSSTVRTMEEIFKVPLLRGAKTATSLSDLFTTFP